MKATKILKATALSALLLAGTSGAALAQELVSGAPHEGYFQGVLVPANGPVIQDAVATEAPSRLVRVEGQAIAIGELGSAEFARINAEALIGLPVEAEVEVTAIAQAN